MTKRIVIVGAGGFGRGVEAWLRSSPSHLARHNIIATAFIDDIESNPSLRSPWFSSLLDYQPSEDDEVICAVGVPAVRRRVVSVLQTRGARFHTFVDDRATIGARVEIGEGSVICPGVVVSSDARVGRHTHINFNSSVGHDVTLGEFTTLSPSVNIMGEVKSSDAVFYGGSAAVLPRLTVGSGATIGAGAVVVQSVADGMAVVGNPARPIKRRPR